MIGSNLLPGSDFVKITSINNLSAQSYTMYDDSVRTDNPSVSYLGQISDPYFGTATAEFVTQIRMGGAWDNLPFIVDSVKLYLHILSVTGGSTTKHYLKISEIAEQIYTDSAYYSNRNVLTTGFEVGDIEIPVLHAGINDDTLTLPPQTLNGPMSFGNYILRDTSKLFYSNTLPDFRTFFKGLYFQIQPSSDPMLISLSLVPPPSTLGLGAYYNYFGIFMSNPAGETKEFRFVLDATNKNAAYNRFVHNFNTATPDKKIQHINDTLYGDRDTLSYLQCLNGVYTKVVLPGLDSLKNDPSMKNIAVNKAKLTIPVQLDGNLYKATTVPSSLILRYRSKAGVKYIVPDYNIDANHIFFSGILDTVANEYNFNIPAFVQGYLEDVTGQVEPELEVFQGAGTSNVILKANNSKTPVKFQFTYTKF